MIAVAALVATAACSDGRDAAAAIEAMKLADGQSGAVKYASKSSSGDKFTFKDVVLSADGGGLRVDTMVLDGLDLTPEGKPTLSDIVLTGLSPETLVPGLEVTLKEVALRDLNPATGAYLASVFSEGQGAPAPAFEAWGLGAAALSGLQVKGDLAQLGAGGAGAFSMTLEQLSFADLDKSVVGKFSLAGLKGDFDVPAEAGAGFPVKGSFDFGTGEIRNLRAGAIANQLVAGIQSAMDPSAASNLEQAMLSAMTSPIDPGYDSLSWTGVNIDAAGLKLTTTKLEQSVARNSDGVAVKVTAPRASVTLAADAAQGQLGAMVGGALGMIGYQSLELYGETETAFDPKTDTTRFAKYSLGLKDGFDLSLTGGFKGVQSAMKSLISAAGADPLATGLEPDLSGLGDLTLVDLDLKLTDKSLVSRLLNLSGLMGAPDPESLRSDIVNQVTALKADLSSAGVDAGLADEVLSAVAEFVAKPGTLSLKLAPKAPLKFGDVSSPDQLTKEALGLSASHSAQ
ncbi:MAG: hypothetical protein KGS00_02480 [Alphaproteobacteria bacterium]|nr:hypothetical protein [Alphaproteobacteria bacterium]